MEVLLQGHLGVHQELQIIDQELELVLDLKDLEVGQVSLGTRVPVPNLMAIRLNLQPGVSAHCANGGGRLLALALVGVGVSSVGVLENQSLVLLENL